MLSGKSILIGITGGIAAYKVCELIRMYKRNNANVRVVCTPNALNFVTKLTLQNLSQNEVGVEEFNVESYKPEHISYADEADIMVIAPATANTIGKIANGICDNLLTSIVCAFQKPIIICPAMNCGMWENSFVQNNLKNLKSKGFHILEPEEGFLACGYNGKGRLCELNNIYNTTINILTQAQKLSGKKITITAGGTIEDIDTVRYISNYSSGKMGISLADTAYEMGADVTLITTVDTQKPYGVIRVKSAYDMQEAVFNEYDTSDCIIMAAAVADYKVKNPISHKIKKQEDSDSLVIELVKNPDILKSLCQKRNKIACGKQLSNTENSTTYPIIVGFCAESENLIENAKEKIQKKGCDYLIANDISRKDIGFSSDYNEITILKNDGTLTHIDRKTKKEIAKIILEKIYE